MRDACTAMAVLVLGSLAAVHIGHPAGHTFTGLLCAVSVILVLVATSGPPRPPGAVFQ
jgi:hypothetical protein